MRILIAIDGSAASESALDEMAARPWPAASTFDVVSVVGPAHLWTDSDAVAEARVRADELVTNAAELLSRVAPAKGLALYGDPKSVIPEHAKNIGADFIVLGAEGAAGSVATGVLRRAACSVEIVRRVSDAAPKKLLLATDGSESSSAAARSIASRPWPEGTEVRVLSSVELILPAGYALFEPPFMDTAAIEEARAAAMKRSQDAIAQARETLAALHTSESISVLLDPPKTIILNEAAQWGAEMIVLGSHGHRGIERVLLGSTSEAVAVHAACSVEVIRA